MTFPASFDQTRVFPKTWYWCSLACQAAYAGAEAYRERIMTWPGPCTWEYVTNPSLVAPDWMFADYGDACAVVLRGTDSGREFWHQALTLTTAVTHPLITGKTWGFFGQAAIDIWAALEPRLATASGAQRVVFTGHSWGGAVALILAMMYKRRWSFDPLCVVHFGAPKSGNGAFADACTWPIFRMENLGDPVPFVPGPQVFRLPPLIAIPLKVIWDPWAHAGENWVFAPDGEVLHFPWNPSVELRQPRQLTTNEVWHQAEFAHQIGIYTQRMRTYIGNDWAQEVAYPDLHPLDVVASEMMTTQGFFWPFAIEAPRGGPALPPNYVPPALAQAMLNVCTGSCCHG